MSFVSREGRLWRNKWKQLGTGDEGMAARLPGSCQPPWMGLRWFKACKKVAAAQLKAEATFPYDGRPPPGWTLCLHWCIEKETICSLEHPSILQRVLLRGPTSWQTLYTGILEYPDPV